MTMGEPYIPMGRELFDQRQHAKEQLFLYNNLAPSKIKARNQLLKGLFKETGSRFFY